MTFRANISELLHELRIATGTVLTIVGSRMEADARAQVDEPVQWLTEFEEARNHLEPDECTCHSCELGHPENCSACITCGSPWCDYFGEHPESSAEDDEDWFKCAALTCPCQDDDRYQAFPDSSAADTAADPSPADNHHASRGAGDEGPEGASAIPPAAPSGHPNDLNSRRCRFTDIDGDGIEHWCDLELGHSGYCEATNDAGERMYASYRNYDGFTPTPPVVAESDPGEVSAPSPGEVLDEDDLAAHIMGDFVSGQDVDPLTATLIDALSSSIARSLLSGYSITRRA